MAIDICSSIHFGRLRFRFGYAFPMMQICCMMEVIYRKADHNDLPFLKALGVRSWARFEHEMEPHHWLALSANLSDDQTYLRFLDQAVCFVCTDITGNIIGMAYLVPSGNPTEIYDTSWCCIRFVSVDPQHTGKGIGRTLTQHCIDLARTNGEQVIALHTSEMMNEARHIYEKLGFKRLKELDKRFGKQYWLYTMALQ